MNSLRLLTVRTILLLFVFFIAPLSVSASHSVWRTQVSPVAKTLASLAVLSPQSAFAVGAAGVIAQWDGNDWRSMTSGTGEDLWSIDAVQDNDIWAVGDRATLLHFNGTQWTAFDTVPPTSENFLGVRAWASNDVWIVGEAGTILHWDGNTWMNFTTVDRATTILYAVSFASVTDGWIVGSGGVVLHWDGSAWTNSVSGVTNTLFQIVARDATHAWAVGEGGIVLRWNGASWQSLPGAASDALLSIAMISNTDGWVVGDNRTIMQTADGGQSWSAASNPLGEPHALLRVALTERGGWAVGTGGSILQRTMPTHTAPPPENPPPVSPPQEPVTPTPPTPPPTPPPVENPPPPPAPEPLPLGKPMLFNPELHATVASGTVSFLWQAVENATSYDLRVAKTSAALEQGNELIINQSGLSATLFTSPQGVLAPGTYFWRARAARGEIKGSWSDISDFIIMAPSAEPPADKPPVKEPPAPVPAVVLLPTEPLLPKTPAPTPVPHGSSLFVPEQGTITLTLAAPAVFATSHPTLIGTLSTANTIATAAIDNQSLVTIPIDASGGFQLPIPVRLMDGSHTLQFMLGDSRSTSASFTVDTTPPASPTIEEVTVARQESSLLQDTVDVVLFVRAKLATGTHIVKLFDPAQKSAIISTPAGQDAFMVTVQRSTQRPGAHTLVLQAEDRIGNASTADIPYTVTTDRILYACSDGVDNDSDGKIDYPEDQACRTPLGMSEEKTLFRVIANQAVVAAVTNAITETTNATIIATQEAAKKVAEKTTEQTVRVAEATEKIVQKSEPAAVTALTAIAPAAIAANPLAASSIPALPGMATNAISWLFSALGIRKKRKNPWGMVYDAITKEPIGLAILRLFDVASSQLLATQVTDKEGRFEFLVKPGQYRIEIQKTPFAFPSRIVEGKEDGDLLDVYHGEAITVSTEGQAMHVNIPIDPENTTLLRTASLRTTFDRIRRIASKASLPLLVIGTGVSIVMYAFSQTRYNLLTLLVYVGFAAYQTILSPKKFKSWGTIFDAMTLEPVPLAMVSIIDPQYQRVIKTRLSDYQGRFTFLPDPGNYQLKVTKQQYQFPSKAENVGKKYHHIYRGEALTVAKKKAIIAVDVPLDPVRSSPPLGPSGALRAGETSNGVDPVAQVMALSPTPPALPPSPVQPEPPLLPPVPPLPTSS